MRELLYYILILILGMAILISVLVIAVCASALVVVADDQMKIELYNIINGRPNHNR